MTFVKIRECWVDDDDGVSAETTAALPPSVLPIYTRGTHNMTLHIKINILIF